MDSRLTELIEYIATNAQPDAAPFPFGVMVPQLIDCRKLLDKISELWQIPKSEIGDIVDPIRIQIENQE